MKQWLNLLLLLLLSWNSTNPRFLAQKQSSQCLILWQEGSFRHLTELPVEARVVSMTICVHTSICAHCTCGYSQSYKHTHIWNTRSICTRCVGQLMWAMFVCMFMAQTICLFIYWCVYLFFFCCEWNKTLAEFNFPVLGFC